VKSPRSGLPLPHAFPFLLLDRVVALQTGSSAEAVKRLSFDDPLLDGSGHLPTILLAEAMAQCAGVAFGGDLGASCVLAKIDRFRSRKRVDGGRDLNVRVTLVRTFGTTVKARGIVRSNGRIVAAGDVVLQLQTGAQRDG